MAFAPKRVRARRGEDVSGVDFGPTAPTSDGRFRCQRLGRGHWRLVRAGTGEHVGPVYESERALLADLPRFAAAWVDTPAAIYQRRRRRVDREDYHAEG